MTSPQLLFTMIRVLCCFTLLWSPIPLASNRPWAWTILELLIALIFSLHLLCVYLGRSAWFTGRWHYWSLLPFVLMLLVLGAQLWSPFTWLSTVDPNQTEILWFKTLFYALFAWLITGYFRTDNTSALQADAKRNEAILGRIPAGRWGEPEDLTGAAVFLASKASDYVNGHVLAVDGGWLAR